MRKPYPSDLTDAQWEIIRPLIPVHKVGGPRLVDMREVLNTILYLVRSGCQRDMLPHDLLPKSTVYDHFAQRSRGDAPGWSVLAPSGHGSAATAPHHTFAFPFKDSFRCDSDLGLVSTFPLASIQSDAHLA